MTVFHGVELVESLGMTTALHYLCFVVSAYLLFRRVHIFLSYLTQFMEWEMFQTKVSEKVNTHFTLNNFFLKIMSLLRLNGEIWLTRTAHIIWRMRIVCWIRKAIDTNSEYVILVAFLLQHWLQEHAPVLRNAYFCLSCSTGKTFILHLWSIVLNLKDQLASTHDATYLWILYPHDEVASVV
jgi:hypothetical protein